MKSPASLSPQCATVSASMKPGWVTSHTPVWMGMCFFSNVPGLVPDNPQRPGCARAGLSKRSIVAAEMAPSRARVSTDSGLRPVS